MPLPHPWSRDSQGQETFLAPSAGKQTRNYYRMLKQLSLSIAIMHWYCAVAGYSSEPYICKFTTRIAIVRLIHPRSGDSQREEMFLIPSAKKYTCNYDVECTK